MTAVSGDVAQCLTVPDRDASAAAALAGLPPLDDDDRNEGIGDPGAFLMVAEGCEALETTVRRKIIREITSGPGPLAMCAHA